MKRLQKPPVGKTREKKKEPLAEGLQTFPTDYIGRILWGRINDEQIVKIAQKLMEEKGVNGREELIKVDSKLYGALRRRRLLGEIGFVEKQRSWKDMNDEDIIEYAMKLMNAKGICEKSGLCAEDQGLYNILHRRGLIRKIEFDEKARVWREMSDEEIIELAMKVMKEKNVTGKKELSRADRGVYEILSRRGLLAKINFTDKCKWRDRRSWSKMSDTEIVEFARGVMEENEISGKRELAKADNGLYTILYKRGLLDEVEFDNKRRKQRSWKNKNDDEVVEFAQKHMLEEKITGRMELQKADPGLYVTLRQRGLLDRAFAHVEQQRTEKARDAVIDALTKFAATDEKPEVGVA
ncbi:hypothetical protein KKE38_03740 [Candidatus Micrarchaeota archaeon]|nr:hypothetical protein [Candidatus Micrarchaeota archaeon]